MKNNHIISLMILGLSFTTFEAFGRVNESPMADARPENLRLQEQNRLRSIHNRAITNLLVDNWNNGYYPWLPYEIIVTVQRVMWDGSDNNERYDLAFIVNELYRAIHSESPASVNYSAMRFSN